MQRIDWAGDRVVVTGSGIIHDMRCDGTFEGGVHDVAEFDKATCIDAIATFRARRSRSAFRRLGERGAPLARREHLRWQHVGFTTTFEGIATPDGSSPDSRLTDGR